MNLYFKSWLIVLLQPFKILLRVTFIIAFCGLLKVNAVSYGQRLIMENNTSRIRDVFKAIKLQTGYDVLWQENTIELDKVIHLSSKITSMEAALKDCLANEDLHFKIEDNTIILIRKPVIISHNGNIVKSQDSLVYKGNVRDEKGIAMPGATVRIKGTKKSTKTGDRGDFEIVASTKSILVITFLGYVDREITLSGRTSGVPMEINMSPGQNLLGEVNIVGTGFQELPKERATGSFEVITKEQLQHSSDPNLIKRLEGITTSMNFNNQLVSTNSADKRFAVPPLYNLTIRGKNTINVTNFEDNLSGVPLVVIDGIPNPYPIDQVNPNDVESITILKDAASASIWGSRAANGVIVIKTKRSSYNKPISISFNSNLNISEKFDLFYKKYMSTSDFVDALSYQYNRQYDPANPSAYLEDATSLFTPQIPLSPVGELINQQKMGKITAEQLKTRLDELRSNDIRHDFDKYLLRGQSTQGYSLSIDGGSKRVSQRFSIGYDKTLNNTVNSDNSRIATQYSTSFNLIKNLDLTGNLSYNLAKTNDQATQNVLRATTGNGFYPFTKLADNDGNYLSIPYKYRESFLSLIKSNYGNKILDMTYAPLEDINQGYTKSSTQNINLNLGANYRLWDFLSTNVSYNFNYGYSDNTVLERQDSFYMRELINTYTSVAGDRNIPLGGQYSPTITKRRTQNVRGQLNFDKSWNGKHQLNAIAGVDLSEFYRLYRSDQYYGYDERSLLFNAYRINYTANLPFLWSDPFVGISNGRIPYNYILNEIRNRTASLFSNAAYTYKNRYTISASVRKDMDSQFGIGTNKGGTPFYSIGGKWNTANEIFYRLDWLPILQVRATYGYNGNTNPLISGLPVLAYSSTPSSLTGLFLAGTSDSQGISNSELRPEKTGVANIGLDFGTRNNRFGGSIEYYDKRTKDLLSEAIIDPSTGLRRAVINTANLHGRGFDINLNSLNIHTDMFRWNTSFLMSYNKVIVTKLFNNNAVVAGDIIASTGVFEQGKSINRIYAYKWAGLNPTTGDPRGVYNGQSVSIATGGAGNNAFNNIYNAPTNTAIYFGSSVPVYFGSLRNSFSYGNFSIGFNLLYKFDYYFRRPPSDVVRYSQLFSSSSNTLLGIEYNSRWTKPGDELLTNVPSLNYPASPSRDNFYYYSAINVLKADHVRLQEVNLSYIFTKKSWFLKNVRVYANVSNLGVVWRANKLGLDPDINDYPNPRTYAFGISTNF